MHHLDSILTALIGTFCLLILVAANVYRVFHKPTISGCLLLLAMSFLLYVYAKDLVQHYKKRSPK